MLLHMSVAPQLWMPENPLRRPGNLWPKKACFLHLWQPENKSLKIRPAWARMARLWPVVDEKIADEDRR